MRNKYLKRYAAKNISLLICLLSFREITTNIISILCENKIKIDPVEIILEHDLYLTEKYDITVNIAPNNVCDREILRIIPAGWLLSHNTYIYTRSAIKTDSYT